MEIGLSRKIGISQNWNLQNWREHCMVYDVLAALHKIFVYVV